MNTVAQVNYVFAHKTLSNGSFWEILFAGLEMKYGDMWRRFWFGCATSGFMVVFSVHPFLCQAVQVHV